MSRDAPPLDDDVAFGMGGDDCSPEAGVNDEPLEMTVSTDEAEAFLFEVKKWRALDYGTGVLRFGIYKVVIDE